MLPIPTVDMDYGIGDFSVPCTITRPPWSAQKWVEKGTSWWVVGGCWWNVVSIAHAPFQGLIYRLNRAHTDSRWLL